MQIWSTENLPPDRQFAAWRQRLMQNGTPAHADRPGPADAPFPAFIRSSRIGGCAALTLKAPRHRMELRPRGDTAGEGPSCFLLLFGAPARIRTPSQQFEVAENGVLLIDPQCNEEIEDAAEVRYYSLRVPRRLIGAHVASRDWTSPIVPIEPDEPAGALVSGYMRTLFQEGERLQPDVGNEAVETLCRLAGMALRGAHGNLDRGAAAQMPVRAVRLMQVKRAATLRISEPDLSPATLAKSLGMSARTLHLLFASSGETFGEFIAARRLDDCRIALTDPAQRHRSVTDIAFGCGFSSLSTFYRAFQTAYNMTPSAMRERGANQPS